MRRKMLPIYYVLDTKCAYKVNCVAYDCLFCSTVAPHRRVARIDTVHSGVFEGNEHSVAVGAATHCVGNPLVFFGGEV
jgi:hypothetical protein